MDRAFLSHGKYFIFIVSMLTLWAFFASEATAQGEAGLSIFPAIIEETLDPGETQNYSITVKNLNPFEQKFYVSKLNITDVLDGGVPVFSDRNDEKTGMELADWISLPVNEITLASGFSERISFDITIPADGSPGSHFGSILISADPPEIASSGAAIGYQVANIISIRVSGDVNENANIRQFSTKRFFNGSKNIDFSAKIENTGNVLVRPVGPVEIRNMLGQQVDSFIFNQAQSAVFPGKTREYTFAWAGEGAGFGRYEAIVSPGYGDTGAKKTVSSTVTFWILPLNIIGPALGILAALLIITFVFVRLYIKRTLAHLSHGQSRIVTRRKNRGVSATLLLIVVMLTVTALFMIVLLALFA